MATIPRVVITESMTEYEPIKDDLFLHCRARLGYDVDDVTKDRRDVARLNSVLKAAGVEPLSLRHVEKYKLREERRANHFWSKVAMQATVIAVVNYFLISAAWHEFMHRGDTGDIVIGCIFLLMINAGTAVACGAALWMNHGKWEWRSTPLKGYKLPVPEFALAYALAIRNLNEECRFTVEELKYQKRVADPFLAVHLGDRMAYIAVWDEPKFEGRATA